MAKELKLILSFDTKKGKRKEQVKLTSAGESSYGDHHSR